MLRLAGRIFTTALALIGLATVAGWIMPLLRGVPPVPNDLTSVVSPDGAFKAVLASWNGGGAIAPFCYDRVFIVPEATPNDRVAGDNNLVFAADCATFEDHSNSPVLLWRGPRLLLIKFSTSQSAVALTTLRIRRLASEGKVIVEFEFAK